LSEALAVVERLKLTTALQQTSSRAAAADLLGISPRTLASKLKELRIDEREDSDV
jgi:DNA-binding NtrC family response regulator